jgi:CheY-like chemotaxis protein
MSEQIISLILVDQDPIFRLGLANVFQNYREFRVINQTDHSQAALAMVTQENPDLVIAEWDFCQDLLENNPQLNIFLLTNISDPIKLQLTQQLGVKGFANKGIAIAQLILLLNKVANGESCWPNFSDLNPTPKTTEKPLILPAFWLSQIRHSGLDQINLNLITIEAKLKDQLSPFDQFFWQGRKRELKAARWLVKQLIPFELIINTSEQTPQKNPTSQQSEITLTSSSLPFPNPPVNQYTKTLLENILTKIQLDPENLTTITLEIDLLKPEKRRELFYIILDRFYQTLEELKYLKATAPEIATKQNQLIKTLWQEAALTFWQRNFASLTIDSEPNFSELILAESDLIEQEILTKIPYILDLINYLLFEQKLIIDQVEYRLDAPEAIERANLFLSNLILQISNAIVQVILNNLYDLEQIKNSLYHKNLISSRAIARFRNDLSWRYRQEKYFKQPQYIFESQHRLLYFSHKGIEKIMIYAPRQEELKQLQGLAWWVTIAFEFRDAVAPRFRAVIAFVGQGLVYVLTQIIGRGIGLIGRGILQGVGNTFQEGKFNSKK